MKHRTKVFYEGFFYETVDCEPGATPEDACGYAQEWVEKQLAQFGDSTGAFAVRVEAA